MKRTLFFLGAYITPIVFGWWFFVVVSIVSIFLFKRPYELILIAAMLDNLYYFGDGFIFNHAILLIALLSFTISVILEDKINWNRVA